MAENGFTKYFKRNLKNRLEFYFDKEEVKLEVVTEYPIKFGDTTNYIDIGISDPEKDNLLVGIEIENISSRDQIFKNYDKFKNWVHKSKQRKGGLLHIVSYEANIDYEDNYELFLRAYDDTSKGLGFFYEFFALNDLNKIDRREYDKLSEKIVCHSWEFDVRLFALISMVFGKEYINYY